MYALLSEYIEYGEREKLNEKTLKEYFLFVHTFLIFLADIYPDITDITDVTRDVILSYEKYLVTMKDSRGKILARNRRKRYLTNLRTFFTWLQKEEKIYKNPTANMALPKERKTIVKDILNHDEMDKLLKNCSGDSLKDLRDRAMLELLYSAGLRAEELCALEIKDIDFDEHVLLVRKGKLGNERIIPFGDSAEYWVKRYIQNARNLINESGHDLVFVSMRGKRLQPVTLCRIIKENAVKAGIEKNVTTHTFRHSCASHLLKGGADIRYVQKQLGHKSISTTEKYLKVEITDLKEVHKRCHPREQDSW